MPDLGTCALAHARVLAEAIGPRPAGSPAEARARDYVAGELTRLGYAVERQPVSFAPPPRFFALYATGGLALIVAALLLARLPALALLTPLYLVALPQLGRGLIARRARCALSENLVVHPPPGARARLYLCAHLDSAPASAYTRRPLLWLHGQWLFLGQRTALALAALAALNLLGLGAPPWLAGAVAALAGIIGAGWLLDELVNQLGRGDRYAPGANDNASGAGVLLALAEHYAGREGARPGFLFTGAEETGLHGARAFAARPEARGARVLNLDMVGAGRALCYAAGDGTLRPVRADARLNALVRAADPAARGLWYTQRSGDFLPFLEAGIPAASLEMRGALEAALAYHTVHDTAAGLDPAALDRAARAAQGVITRLLQ